jgi:DNA-binding NtrC family response regulator
MTFRLLIVDDDAVTLLGLRDALQLKFPDATITTTDSAENALSVLNTSRFDAVLTDVKMPGIGGMLLLGEIKRRYPKCLVLVMTGHDPELRVEALRQGASAFLEKPLDMERLPRLLSRALDHARLINALHDRNRQSIGPDQ